MADLPVDDCIAIAAQLEMYAGIIMRTHPHQSDEIITLIRKIRWAIATDLGFGGASQ